MHDENMLARKSPVSGLDNMIVASNIIQYQPW